MKTILRRAFVVTSLLLAVALPPASATTDPLPIADVDQKPTPVRTLPPEYPRELQARQISGMVLLELVIDDTGHVADAVVLKSTESGFNAPTMLAVRKWIFKPARKDGQDVWVRFKMPIKFSPEA